MLMDPLLGTDIRTKEERTELGLSEEVKVVNERRSPTVFHCFFVFFVVLVLFKVWMDKVIQ